MPSFRTGEVAELAGVSVDVVRRWCDDGTLASTRTAGGHRQVEGAELARFLATQEEAFQPPSLISQSARNRFTGVVTRVERDKVAAIVEIRAGRHRIVSMLTREAVDEMGIAPGDLAVAVVKATNVIVEMPG
jgi:molybdopterin-binding protein